jgi:ATP-dependent RNA helicase RhlE
MRFADLQLSEPLLRAVQAEGYTTATPIQVQAIPHVLAGHDLMGCAQTGTGKTAAFALPLLHRLAAVKPATAVRRVRCLVLCPTRELAVQIGQSFQTYGQFLPLRYAVVYGGVGQNSQVQALRRGADVVVATPGRLMDLMEQRHADLHGVQTLVLDEADRMLDMGFIPAIRRIVAQLPAQRQTLMFSATMPAPIRQLANTLLHEPALVQVAPTAATADGIEQAVYFVERPSKTALLAHLVRGVPQSRVLVFTRTKHGADRVVLQLHHHGIRAAAIHGNKAQNARQRALEDFRSGRVPVLVATDIASRGIDVDAISHVVNYDVTHEPEAYVHRIGRTARAGASGIAISFCDRQEVSNLRAIERLIRKPIPVLPVPPEVKAAPPAPAPIHSATPHAGTPRTGRWTPRPAAPATPNREGQGARHWQRGRKPGASRQEHAAAVARYAHRVG